MKNPGHTPGAIKIQNYQDNSHSKASQKQDEPDKILVNNSGKDSSKRSDDNSSKKHDRTFSKNHAEIPSPSPVKNRGHVQTEELNTGLITGKDGIGHDHVSGNHQKKPADRKKEHGEEPTMKADDGNHDERVLLSNKKSGSNPQRIKQDHQKDPLSSPKKKPVDHGPYGTSLDEFEERVSQISDHGKKFVHDSREESDHKKKAGDHGRSRQAQSGKLSGTACVAYDLKFKLRNLLSAFFKQLNLKNYWLYGRDIIFGLF